MATGKTENTENTENQTEEHGLHQPEPDQSPLADTLTEITRRICSVSQPERIILFGSYARNEQRATSDRDLLVVVPDVESTRQESIRLQRALLGLCIPIDIVVATTQQIERHRHTPGLIYAIALQEGKVIYDHTPSNGHAS
jgi:predicted nucleotidyltransferase